MYVAVDSAPKGALIQSTEESFPSDNKKKIFSLLVSASYGSNSRFAGRHNKVSLVGLSVGAFLSLPKNPKKKICDFLYDFDTF